MKNVKIFERLLLVALIMAAAGCTSDSPTVPPNLQSMDEQVLRAPTSPPENQIKLSGEVVTIDSEGRLLNLEGIEYAVSVPQECLVALVEGGEVTPIMFGDIEIGDWLKVCGLLQDDGSVTAKKIVVYVEGECDGYDLAFRDSISTINYAAGSFTVYGRNETVMIDGNTVITIKVLDRRSPGIAAADDGALLVQPNDDLTLHSQAIDSLLEFTDLGVGMTLEVKADIVDPTTLLAVKINVAARAFMPSLEFTDYLASLDGPNRLATFESELRVGYVCPGALLLDSDGETLSLADFAAGDLVDVKSVLLATDTLKISEMIKR